MRYRRLGASTLEVSVISLGSWLTFGVGVERDGAIACVRRALELGINLIDTANVMAAAPPRPCWAKPSPASRGRAISWRPRSSAR
jgi:diketogulonate reductase-like aldo/keto reductase